MQEASFRAGRKEQMSTCSEDVAAPLSLFLLTIDFEEPFRPTNEVFILTFPSFSGVVPSNLLLLLVNMGDLNFIKVNV